MNATLYGATLDSLLESYNQMRSLVIKMASAPAPKPPAPEIVLEKVASIPERVSAARASTVVDALVKRGFVTLTDREAMIRSLCMAKPDGVCDILEKIAAMAAPLEPNFDDRLEERDGSSTSSEHSKSATGAWLAAAGNARSKP